MKLAIQVPVFKSSGSIGQAIARWAGYSNHIVLADRKPAKRLLHPEQTKI